MGARFWGKLALVHEQGGAAVGFENRKAERQGRVRHVGAADIEQPGNGIRLRQHRSVRAGFCYDRANFATLLSAAAPRIALIERHHGHDGRRRLLRPRPIERTIWASNQGRAGLLRGTRERLNRLGRVQPRVIAEPVAGFKIGRDPLGSRLLD